MFKINVSKKSNKDDFRYFLDEESNLTNSTKNDYCGTKTKKFFKNYLQTEFYLVNASCII